MTSLLAERAGCRIAATAILATAKMTYDGDGTDDQDNYDDRGLDYVVGVHLSKRVYSCSKLGVRVPVPMAARMSSRLQNAIALISSR